MPEYRVPADLGYTKNHEWVRADAGSVTVGITDFAQNALGEVTYVELPDAGAELEQGKEFAVVESLKAASDVYAPVSGTVAAVNEKLEEEPKMVNAAPYGDGWLCKLSKIQEAELAALLSPEQYAELISSNEAQS